MPLLTTSPSNQTFEVKGEIIKVAREAAEKGVSCPVILFRRARVPPIPSTIDDS